MTIQSGASTILLHKSVDGRMMALPSAQDSQVVVSLLNDKGEKYTGSPENPGCAFHIAILKPITVPNFILNFTSHYI